MFDNIRKLNSNETKPKKTDQKQKFQNASGSLFLLLFK